MFVLHDWSRDRRGRLGAEEVIVQLIYLNRVATVISLVIAALLMPASSTHAANPKLKLAGLLSKQRLFNHDAVRIFERVEGRLRSASIGPLRDDANHLALAAMTLDHEFVNLFFGPEIAKNLLMRFPELRLLRPALDASLRVVVQNHPGLVEATAIELARSDIRKYSHLVAFSSGSEQLTLRDLNNHLRSLLRNRIEQETDIIRRSVGLSNRTPSTSNLREFLEFAMADSAARERGAERLLSKWSAESDSIVAVLRVGEASMERKYQYGEAATSAIAGAAGGLLGYELTEQFIGSSALWARNPCPNLPLPDEDIVVVGRVPIPSGCELNGLKVGK